MFVHAIALYGKTFHLASLSTEYELLMQVRKQIYSMYARFTLPLHLKM